MNPVKNKNQTVKKRLNNGKYYGQQTSTEVRLDTHVQVGRCAEAAATVEDTTHHIVLKGKLKIRIKDYRLKEKNNIESFLSVAKKEAQK